MDSDSVAELHVRDNTFAMSVLFMASDDKRNLSFVLFCGRCIRPPPRLASAEVQTYSLFEVGAYPFALSIWDGESGF
jgi:hypothetical protein